MAMVTQEFQSAPAGKRVIRQMVFAMVAAILGCAAAVAVFYRKHTHNPTTAEWAFGLISPICAIAFGIPGYLAERSRVAQFRIEENVLVLGKERFPLQGLAEVNRDPDVLSKASRTVEGRRVVRMIKGPGSLNRSGKFCSIVGTFQSKRLGKFYAFLTGTEKAVVLRWPDSAVAVSPEDPEFFIYMVRSGAGLR